MTEYEACSWIVDRCKELGLLCHWCCDSTRCSGTPGLPDLLIVSVKGSLWIEMKLNNFSTVSPGQTTWKHTLKAAGMTAEIMTVSELEDIFGMLDDLA